MLQTWDAMLKVLLRATASCISPSWFCCNEASLQFCFSVHTLIRRTWDESKQRIPFVRSAIGGMIWHSAIPWYS